MFPAQAATYVVYQYYYQKVLKTVVAPRSTHTLQNIMFMIAKGAANCKINGFEVTTARMRLICLQNEDALHMAQSLPLSNAVICVRFLEAGLQH